jgi:hypothetical protein
MCDAICHGALCLSTSLRDLLNSSAVSCMQAAGPSSFLIRSLFLYEFCTRNLSANKSLLIVNVGNIATTELDGLQK